MSRSQAHVKFRQMGVTPGEGDLTTCCMGYRLLQAASLPFSAAKQNMTARRDLLVAEISFYWAMLENCVHLHQCIHLVLPFYKKYVSYLHFNLNGIHTMLYLPVFISSSYFTLYPPQIISIKILYTLSRKTDLWHSLPRILSIPSLAAEQPFTFPNKRLLTICGRKIFISCF